MNRYPGGKESGFSLVELCTVLAGAMILIVSAVPAYTSVVNSFRLVMSAGTITTELQFARMKAVSSNEVFQVRFDAAQRSYQVETGAGTVVAGPFQLPDGIVLNAGDGQAAITFGSNIVAFSPTGTVAPSGSGAGSAGHVRIMNPMGSKVEVTVSTAGAVRQSRIYKSASPTYQ
jgi:Tfp pilus assembly protein FimT